jgi:subtilisin family serine protease
MQSFLVFLIIIAATAVNSFEIVDYLKDEESHGRLGSESYISIQKRMESIWVIRVLNGTVKESNNSKETREFLTSLRQVEIKEKDACLLMKLFIVDGSLVFRIYCNASGPDNEGSIRDNPLSIENGSGGVDGGDEDDETKTPTLYHTLKRLKDMYGENNVEYEKDSVIRKPNYWYGRTEHIQRIVNEKLAASSDHNRKKKGKGNHSSPSSYYETLLTKEDWPYFSESNPPWGLDRMDQRFGGLDNTYHYINNASSVDIYIIDTGIRTTHASFGGRALFLINAVGDNINTDCNGHGTHVAATAAGSFYGVAQGATVIAAKALDCVGDGDLFTIQSAVLAIIQSVHTREGSSSPKTRRSVVNLSLGGSKSTLLESAILMLSNAGIVTTVSAGNLGADACFSSPAALGGLDNNNKVLSVGASDRYDTRPSFSNYGSCVSLSAPGVGITSAWWTSDTASRTLDGTSMSSPHVAGTAAIILQTNLQLTNAQVNLLIIQGATPNIVNGASSIGGGKNLLFSLIDASPIVTPAPTVKPPPTPLSPPPPPPPLIPPSSPVFNNGGGDGSSVHKSFHLYVLSIVTFIVLIGW